MSRSLFPAAVAGLALATGCFADTGGSAAPPRLADAAAGWSLAVPSGWRTGGPVVATAFARGARCKSAFVVDRDDEGGPGPSVSRSYVQVCSRPRADDRTLAAFLQATYGSSFAAQFAPATLAGRSGFASRRSDPELVFLQTRSHRLQLASSATKDPLLRDRRRAQVAGALRSLRLRPSA